jgi:predicted SAM-dependent methyltransferase
LPNGKTKALFKMKNKINLLFRKKILNYYKQFIWHFNKPDFPKNPDGKVLLHIGVGDQNDPRYINIDARYLSHVHIVTKKLHRLTQFKTDSVDLIYICHLLEHIKVFDLSLVLSEMYRILKPGGIIRISVPDFDKIINVFQQCNNDIASIRVLVLGGQDYKFNFHYSIFNENYLKMKLIESGFNNVSFWHPEDAEYYSFDDWAKRKYNVGNAFFEISLNMEAQK